MVASINTFSLSAIQPVGLKYSFNNKEETLISNLKTFDNGFSYIEHGILKSFEDIALSKHNCIALTDAKTLKDVISVGTKVSKNFLGNKITNCSLYIKHENGNYFKKYKNGFYAGGIGNVALFNIIVVGDNLIEIKTSRTETLRIQQTYPFDIYVSNEEVDPTEAYTKQFEFDYYENFITLRCKVEGGRSYRYLSCGQDKKLRAVGAMVNDTSINSYFLIPEFLSTETELIEDSSRLDSVEVFYYNELTGEEEYENLSVRKKQQNETNMLLTFPTAELMSDDKAKINIAMLKSNFSASGAYSTK